MPDHTDPRGNASECGSRQNVQKYRSPSDGPLPLVDAGKRGYGSDRESRQRGESLEIQRKAELLAMSWCCRPRKAYRRCLTIIFLEW